MKKILSILMAVAVIFTFSFAGAFAETYKNASVGAAVEKTIATVDTSKYLVKDVSEITTAQTTLIAATKDKETYDADVIAAINTFNETVAAVKTYDSQKADLAEYKTKALTQVDNKIAVLTTNLTNAYKDQTDDLSRQRYSTLITDVNTYKEYFKDKINAVEIVSNKVVFDEAEKNYDAAKSEIDGIVNDIRSGRDENSINLFYSVRDKLNNRTSLYTEADNYAATLKTIKKAGTDTRLYSDAAIAKTLTDVKADIKILKIDSYDKIYTAMNLTKTVDVEDATSLVDYKTAAISSITTGNYASTNWTGSAKTSVQAIQTEYTGYITNANSKSLVDAYVSQAKEAIGKYKTDAQIAADEKKLADLEKENKDLTDKLAKSQLDTKITNLVNAQTDTLRCTSKKVKGNIKVYVKGFDTTEIAANGYTVKYTFYRAEKKSSNYKKMFTTTKGTYTNTYGEKGIKYFYKVKITVYDKDGAEVVSTKLSDCRSAYRIR